MLAFSRFLDAIIYYFWGFKNLPSYLSTLMNLISIQICTELLTCGTFEQVFCLVRQQK